MADNISNSNEAENNPPNPRLEWRQERRVWDRIFNELTYDIIPSQLSEDDIRNILLVPAEKRDELYRVHDADIVYRYVPRVHDGFDINHDRARDVLCHAMELTLHEKLMKIDGYAHLTEKKLPDGRWQYVVHYWRGKHFTLPDFLNDLPIITTCEDMADGPSPGGFKWERLPPADDPSRDQGSESGNESIPPLQSPFFSAGTIAFLGIFDQGGVQKQVFVTVGHLVDASELLATPDDDLLDLCDLTNATLLPPIDECDRVWDDHDRGIRRPKFRKTSPFNPCLEDICLISAEELPADSPFRARSFLLPVKCSMFYTIPRELRSIIPKHIIDHSPRMPDNISHLIKSLRNVMPMVVFKKGIKTGITAGIMTAIRPYSRCNTSVSSTDGDAQPLLSKKDDLYCIVTQWLSAGEPFADEGDSGSLVLAIREDQIVPLGIHFGSAPARMESYAYLLWYWCAELENSLDGELLFCNDDCTSSREGVVSTVV